MNRTSNSETPDTVTPGSQQKSKEEEEEEWRFEGHRFIGEVRLASISVPALGVIQKWLPASGEDPELFHVLHDDGDEEDLEMVEATLPVYFLFLGTHRRTAESFIDSPAKALKLVHPRL